MPVRVGKSGFCAEEAVFIIRDEALNPIFAAITGVFISL